MTPDSAALAALLVAGHALGDFVFQSDGMTRRKDEPLGILAHTGVVGVCHAALLFPFLGRRVLLAVVAIALTHLIIDWGESLAARKRPSYRREWFLLDQLAHLCVLAIAWAYLAPRASIAFGWVPTASTLSVAGILVAAYAFNVRGMSAVVEAELTRLELMPNKDDPETNRIIGILERLFAVTLVLLDRWEALGLLVAAKSLARFKGLEEQCRAEYYLIGTLVSLLGAAASGLLARFLLARV